MSSSPYLSASARVGSVHYNNYSFPPAIHSKVRFEPLYDPAERGIKATRLHFTIEFIILQGMTGSSNPPANPAGAADDSMTAIRRRLTQPGMNLAFSLQGIGTVFSIGPSGTFRDVNYGPKPKLISWEPIGSNAAARVVWECTAEIADCEFPQPFNRVEYINYDVNWSINREGMTTRTISGEFSVPVARGQGATAPATNISQTAEDFRESVVNAFNVLDQFHRESDFTLSEDRKRLSFTLVDTEIASPNPYQPGMIDMDVNYKTSSSLDDGFAIWPTSLEGSITVAPGVQKLMAWLAFIRILEDLLANLPRGSNIIPHEVGESGPSGEPRAQNVHAFLTDMSITDHLFSRSVSFDLSWWVFTTLQSIFAATGILEPLSISQGDADWSLWKSSLSNIQGPRGWQELTFFPEDDIIIDVCNSSVPLSSNTPGISENTPGTASLFQSECPPPEESWLKYENKYVIVSNEGTVEHTPLVDAEPRKEIVSGQLPKVNTDYKPLGQTEILTESSGGTAIPTPPKIRNKVHPTEVRVIMIGSATRIGYQITPPNLVSVGGVDAIKRGKDKVATDVNTVGSVAQNGRNCGLYTATWIKEYTLATQPTQWKPLTDGRPELYR